LLHAACDALLGAAGLGDLGRHFPDADPDLEGVSSITLLRRVVEMVRGAGFEVQNLDSTIVAQSPKLAPHIDNMVGAIGDVLGVENQQVNVKATTTEGMGFTGSAEGIAAYAVATIVELGK
jgi:2-C-methyl-D-erythritol 2,4-cyclodiphosphate synthase